jgi:hypothetical protein
MMETDELSPMGRKMRSAGRFVTPLPTNTDHHKSKGDREFESSVKLCTISSVVTDLISILKDQLAVLGEENYQNDGRLRKIAGCILMETEGILKLKNASHFGKRYICLVRSENRYQAKRDSLLSGTEPSEKSELLQGLKGFDISAQKKRKTAAPSKATIRKSSGLIMQPWSNLGFGCRKSSRSLFGTAALFEGCEYIVRGALPHRRVCFFVLGSRPACFDICGVSPA